MKHRGPFICLAVLCAATLASDTRLHANSIQLKAGDDLQAAINAANPGDTILLPAGATFTGNFVLPAKSGTEFITIRSAPDSSLPGEGMRITPAHAPMLAKIRASLGAAALRTAPGAHHWRLLLLEFPSTVEGAGEIIQLGDGTSAQNQLSQVPYDIELDRLYIHGDPLLGQKRGVALNAASVVIKNSYISDIKSTGADTQAIGGWNGPGPYTIENNYLEAAGENIMFGGADPWIAGLVPNDITIRNNHVAHPMSWRDPIVPTVPGVTAATLGGGSLAAGTYSYRVIARRRIGGGQMIRSTASDAATVAVPGAATAAVNVSWSAVPDVNEYRLYRRSPSGVEQFWTVTGTSFVDTGASGTGGTVPTSPGERWVVKNLFELKNSRNVLVEGNLFENSWASGQSGYAILFTVRNQDGKCTWCIVENVTFTHNIVRNAGGGFILTGSDDTHPSQQTKNIRITHNLIYGITSSLGGHGWLILMSRGPDAVVMDHNTIDSDGDALMYISGPEQLSGFQFTNNAARHNAYGIGGDVYATTMEILSNYTPGAIIKRNWLQGGQASRYPADNLFSGTFDAAFVDRAAGDYRAAQGGVLYRAATDATDIGAPVGALFQMRDGVVAGKAGASVPRPKNLRIVSQ